MKYDKARIYEIVIPIFCACPGLAWKPLVYGEASDPDCDIGICILEHPDQVERKSVEALLAQAVKALRRAGFHSHGEMLR